MPTINFSIKKSNKIGTKKTPSYAITIPKHFIKEGIFNINKETTVVLSQEEDGADDSPRNSPSDLLTTR